MAVPRSFDFNKSYEEVTISGNDYRIEFNDAKMIEYNKTFDKFYVESKEMKEIDTEKLSIKEQEDLFIQMQALTKKTVETLLGEGSYDVLYEASGHSLMNMIEMIEYLSDVIGEKMERIQSDRKRKYTVKKKR